MAAENYKESIKECIIKEKKREIYKNTEIKVMENEQDKVFKQVSDEINFTFECFRKELENMYKKQFQETQEKIEKAFNESVQQESEKKIAQKEKILHIK